MPEPTYVWVIEQHLHWTTPHIDRYKYLRSTPHGIVVQFCGTEKRIPKTEGRQFAYSEDEAAAIIRSICKKSLKILRDQVAEFEEKMANPLHRVHENRSEPFDPGPIKL